jgi:hypothetical protein
MSTSSSLSETQLWSFRFLQVAYLQDMITNANRRGILCWTLLLQCVMISGRCLGLMYLLQPHMQRFVTWKVIGMTITAEPSRHELADDFYQRAVHHNSKHGEKLQMVPSSSSLIPWLYRLRCGTIQTAIPRCSRMLGSMSLVLHTWPAMY